MLEFATPQANRVGPYQLTNDTVIMCVGTLAVPCLRVSSVLKNVY